MVYKCPLCGSTLTENHYHKVIKLQKKKEKVQKGELEKMKKQTAAATAAAAAAKRKEQEIRAKAKQDVEAAKKQAVLNERNKNAVRFKRMQARNRKLQEEMQMLKKHAATGFSVKPSIDEIVPGTQIKGSSDDDTATTPGNRATDHSGTNGGCAR